MQNDTSWHKLSADKSVYHDNGDDYPEKKYIRDDGREAVFDGKNNTPMNDPRYKATYNYYTIYLLPEERTAKDYVKLATSYVGHAVLDVVPYYLFLKSNTREEFERKVKRTLD